MPGHIFGLRNFSAQFYGVLNRLPGFRSVLERRRFDISANITVAIFRLNLGLLCSAYNCISCREGGGGEGDV